MNTNKKTKKRLRYERTQKIRGKSLLWGMFWGWGGGKGWSKKKGGNFARGIAGHNGKTNLPSLA